MAPEGTIFDVMAGRYAKDSKSNFEIINKGHAGDAIRVDRVGRPTVYVPNPALTMGLTVQPHVINGLVQTPAFQGRGLLGRFLYSQPVSLVGRRDVDPPAMPEAVRKAYNDKMAALLGLPVQEENGTLVPRTLHLSPDARRTYQRFAEWVEPKLAPHEELGHMADWGGKLAGAVVRIAGLLHMAERAGAAAPWENPISEKTFARAVLISEYLIPHAQAAYAQMGADPAVDDAKHILSWIKTKAVLSFSKRDLFEGTKGRFKRVEALEAPLRVLVQHEFIREKPAGDRPGPGRKPSPTYEVNPASHNSHNSQNPLAEGVPRSFGPDSANRANSANGDQLFRVSPVSGTSSSLPNSTTTSDTAHAEPAAEGDDGGEELVI